MIYLAQRAAARNSKPQSFRTRLVRCGWITVQRVDGLRRSIPVFRRRPVTAALACATPLPRLQGAACQHLRQRGAPNIVFFHPANGGRRRPIEAAIFKGLGVRPGVADLILLRNNHAYALELKAEGGRPSIAQTEFMSDWIRAGGSGCIVEALDPALRMLETWGLLRGQRT